jgi:uncharacterized repeat protein (TIGR01451 family)
MNGNQMDTNCIGILNATAVNVSGKNISNLSGIQYFDNLTRLNCESNQLSSLPTLPSALYTLICKNNQLITLPILPNSMDSLWCDINQLSSLPNLPNTLTFLICSFNQLNYLPALSNSLIALYCDNNQLSSLPVLPNTLTLLRCRNNQIISLPALSNSITFFDCSSNQLSNLPALPNSLTNLFCGYNQINSLPPLPNSLLQLACNYNQIVSLPQVPSTLLELFCGYNQLNSLPEVPNVMQRLDIRNNNIICLTNLPILSFGGSANISNNPLTCVPNQTSYSLGLPLCTDNDQINNPNNCQSVANIIGNVYEDLNSNCTYNITDLNIQNIPIKLYDNQNNLLALSYTVNGEYSFTALQPDSFVVKINNLALPLSMSCGQTNAQNVTLNSINQTISNVNFPVLCSSAFDIKVHSVTRQGWVFPGQVQRVNTHIANDINWYNLNCGNTTYSGTVTINVNGPVTYVAPALGALTPTVSGNTFTYNISNFNDITPTSFGLKLMTDTTAQAGQQICVHVIISITPTDADTTNNEYTFCYNVVNSYDPNMKEVYPTNVLPGYNDWFTYTIHFQNTGTAPAFNIRLRDTLDTQLDINTFEFLGASHTATTSLNGRNLSVRFNNIMLPDSTSNYQGSMGYYQYRIKPLQNLPNGTNVKNTAYIYFDYNAPIITNTTQNNFDVLTGNRTIASFGKQNGEAISIYPNPSTGILNVECSNLNTNSRIEIINLLGEVVLSEKLLIHHSKFNIQNLPKGVYYCKVNGSAVVKLVKE